MRYYEFIYIVSPEVEDEDLEKVTARVGQLITDGGGELVRLESWGRRRLAYPIRKFREGHYILTHVQLDPEAISGLKERLALTEEVIRYLLVKADAVPVEVQPEAVPAPEPPSPDQAEEEPEREPSQEEQEELVESEADPEEDQEDSEDSDQEEEEGD